MWDMDINSHWTESVQNTEEMNYLLVYNEHKRQLVKGTLNDGSWDINQEIIELATADAEGDFALGDLTDTTGRDIL